MQWVLGMWEGRLWWVDWWPSASAAIQSSSPAELVTMPLCCVPKRESPVHIASASDDVYAQTRAWPCRGVALPFILGVAVPLTLGVALPFTLGVVQPFPLTRGGNAFHMNSIKSSAPDQQQLEAELLFPYYVAQNGLQWLQPIGHYVLTAILIPVGHARIPLIAIDVFLHVML